MDPKGKAPAQDYVQSKRLPMGRPFIMHEGASSGVKKNVSKKYDKQMSGKGKWFNCGKPGHFNKDCNKKPSKLKNKFNMLNINDKE